MAVVHYRLSTALAASFSLCLAACGSSPPSAPPAGASGSAASNTKQASAKESDGIDTEATIWTVLGINKKKGSEHDPGPQTGSNVSPILYQAAKDTLHFAKFASEDPLGGSLVTDWYSPPDKPDERFRIDVFILSRYLTSDAVAVTVDRQVRGPTGEWVESTVDRKVQEELETRILYRARQLRKAWMAQVKS
jgi:Domain of unknown function (DUF3576)